jgi:putative transposase
LIHSIPGTTFSNIEERGDYPSDAKACLTLAELECWLTIAITKYYHLRLHTGIQQPPIKRYELGLELMRKNGKELACIHNAKGFLIDFLPISYRTLRLDGFSLDHIVYFSNALKPFIAERDKYGKFLIRRDHRDLSRIYVYLPDEKMYLEVSYRTISRPAISLFEHRLAIKRLKDLGKAQVHEAALFKAVDEIRTIVKQAEAKTRSIRRNRTRIEENKKVQPVLGPSQNETKVEDNSVEPFTNIEVWK